MIETPGLLVILVRHWTEEDTYAKKPELLWNNPYFALALDQLLQYEQAADREVVIAIADAVDGSAETASRVALKQLSARLQYLKNGNPLQLDSSICFYLMVIHHLSSGSFSTNLRPLLCQGLTPAIAKFLNLLRPVTNHQPVEVPHGIDHCMLATFSIVCTILFSANGPAWVSQFIDAGLVPGILSAGVWLRRLRPDLPSSVAHGVFGYLERYLVYRSVLRSVRKTLKDVKRMRGDQDVSGPLWQEYFVFEKISLQRLDLKAMFDKEVDLGLEPGFLGCKNRAVSVHPPRWKQLC
jgi:hypothetical protein